MNRVPAACLAVLSCLLLSCESPPGEAPGEPVAAEGVPDPGPAPGHFETDPVVDSLVLAMADALRAATSLSFRVEAWTDEAVDDGVHVAIPAESSVLLRFPDRLLVDRVGEKGHRIARYDGSTFSISNPEGGVWARIDAPPTIEETFDLLHEEYGLVVPLADLLVKDPYAAYTEKASWSRYHGLRPVRGVSCHQVSLGTEGLSWQLWIPAEGPPLPRRVEIRYLDEPGVPRFVALIEDWAVDPPTEEGDFAFVPPEGSEEIEVLPRSRAGDDDAGDR